MASHRGREGCRQTVEARIAARIRKVHQGSNGTYQAPRITAELRDEGGPAVNHKRVARIMRTIGIEGVRLRRRHRTTVTDQAAAKAPDLIGRHFTAAEVNMKYVGDITYLPVSGAKPLYLATVIDLASRRLAGWAIADHMQTELVSAALMAAERTAGAWPERSCTRTTISIFEQGLRGTPQVSRGPAEYGRDRIKRGQRSPRKLQRRLQERDAQRPQSLAERA
ncbi:IS3 family transposase [Streptomyces sp. NPDC048489]|uniref:IS3 family transposase n=1 Tax=Streptomyces sp. NPDC048489 TaxID=3154504 RepID=UPI003448DB81